MNSFRDPKYVERYEDVILDLETAPNTTVIMPIMLTKRKMAVDLLLITAERLHHMTGIMLVSVSTLKWSCWLMEVILH